MKAKAWTENSVFEKLDAMFPAPAWVVLRQVANATGANSCRFADAIAVSCWPSRGLYAVGIEIKVSLADLKRELGDHRKSSPIQRFCKHWYIVIPESLHDGSFLLPETWGLITVNRTAKIAIQAPTLESQEPTWGFLASVLRNTANASVPKAEVEARIAERVESGVQAYTIGAQHNIRYLENILAVFRDASGIDLTQEEEWHLGDIGRAVKMIRDAGTAKLSNAAQRIASDAERFAAAANEIRERAAALVAETQSVEERNNL